VSMQGAGFGLAARCCMECSCHPLVTNERWAAMSFLQLRPGVVVAHLIPSAHLAPPACWDAVQYRWLAPACQELPINRQITRRARRRATDGTAHPVLTESLHNTPSQCIDVFTHLFRTRSSLEFWDSTSFILEPRRGSLISAERHARAPMPRYTRATRDRAEHQCGVSCWLHDLLQHANLHACGLPWLHGLHAGSLVWSLVEPDTKRGQVEDGPNTRPGA
jgi:hypothetical protein